MQGPDLNPFFVLYSLVNSSHVRLFLVFFFSLMWWHARLISERVSVLDVQLDRISVHKTTNTWVHVVPLYRSERIRFARTICQSHKDACFVYMLAGLDFKAWLKEQVENQKHFVLVCKGATMLLSTLFRCYGDQYC